MSLRTISPSRDSGGKVGAGTRKRAGKPNKEQNLEIFMPADHLHGKVTVSIDYGKAVVWLDEGGAEPISWDYDTSFRFVGKSRIRRAMTASGDEERRGWSPI
jgi:hypothetical protein